MGGILNMGAIMAKAIRKALPNILKGILFSCRTSVSQVARLTVLAEPVARDKVKRYYSITYCVTDKN